MMNVLAIYPAFDIALNEMAMVWNRLCEQGKVRCTVFAGARDVLKGGVGIALDEHHPNLDIIRLNVALDSEAAIERIVHFAKKNRPDWVFCAIAHNLPAALAVKKQTGAPILLHEEFISDSRMELKRRFYLGLEPLRPWMIRYRARQLLSCTDRAFCSNPAEFDVAGNDQKGGKLLYLPWPHPAAESSLGLETHDSHLAVYIGSVSKVKGASALGEYLCSLLQTESDMRIALVGPATDAAGQQALDRIMAVGGERVSWQKSCSRERALELIGSACFVLSPGKLSNWGLIGDAWGCGTPVIAVASHYDLKAGRNCLVADDVASFLQQVRCLRTDATLWQQLAQSGRQTVSKRHAPTVTAEHLLRGLYLPLVAA